MSEVVYLELEEIVEIHAQLLDLHGGLSGFKDLGAVESAVMRPRNKAHYEEVEFTAAMERVGERYDSVFKRLAE